MDGRPYGSNIAAFSNSSTALWTGPYEIFDPGFQRPDNAIHRINHYPADSVVCFVNIYPLDIDLSSG